MSLSMSRKSMFLSNFLINCIKLISCPSSRFALIAERMKSAFVTPVISDGYCIAKNNPAFALSSTSNSKIFTPSKSTSPLVTS